MSPLLPSTVALLKRIRVPAGILVLTNLVGTLGFWLLWHRDGGTWLDAAFMTFTTITTVGYGEVRPLDSLGRLLSMGVAATGIGTLFYTFTVVLDWATSENTRNERRRLRMQQAIEAMNGHFIVAGVGRVGREAALELIESNAPFLIVDPSAEGEKFAADHNVLFVKGDATEDATLERAGVKRAKGLIVTTANDATNLYVVLTARLLNPSLYIASRAVDKVSQPKLVRAGANRAISPYAIGGRRLAHVLLSPRVVDFFETALRRGNKQLSIHDVMISAASPCASKKMGDLNIRQSTGATVLAILRQGVPQPNPGADFQLEANDHMLALGTDDQLEKLEKLLNP